MAKEFFISYQSDKLKTPLEKAKLYEKAAANPEYLVVGQAYALETAGALWLKAKRPKEAIKDFKKAAELFSQHVTIELNTSKGQDSFYKDAKYHARRAYNCIKTASRIERAMQGKWHGLEGKVSAAAAITGIMGGIFFLSSNLTGNVVGNLNQSSSNFIGIGLFLVGLVGALYYFKKK